jgi:hypothetical protein
VCSSIGAARDGAAAAHAGPDDGCDAIVVGNTKTVIACSWLLFACALLFAWLCVTGKCH